MKHLLVILGLIAGSASASTEFYAHATATETNVFLGQVFNLDVIVKADARPEPPDLSGLNDFNATLIDEGLPTSATITWPWTQM